MLVSLVVPHARDWRRIEEALDRCASWPDPSKLKRRDYVLRTSGCFDPIDVPTGVACKNGVAGLVAQGRYAGIETRRFCASGAP